METGALARLSYTYVNLLHQDVEVVLHSMIGLHPAAVTERAVTPGELGVLSGARALLAVGVGSTLHLAAFRLVGQILNEVEH